jgi:hypothetical protein
MKCLIKQSNIPYIMTRGSEKKDYRAETMELG